MRTSEITYEPTFNGHPIQTNARRGLGCNKRILKRIEDVLTDHTTRHSRSYLFRVDLLVPEASEPTDVTKPFQRCIGAFTEHLDARNGDPSDVWVKERRQSRNDHIHAFFVVDGNKIRNAKPHVRKLEQIWTRKLGVHQEGLAHHCRVADEDARYRSGIMLERNSPDFPEKFDKAFHWMSYMAKINGKADTNGTRTFGSNRVPKGSA